MTLFPFNVYFSAFWPEPISFWISEILSSQNINKLYFHVVYFSRINCTRNVMLVFPFYLTNFTNYMPHTTSFSLPVTWSTDCGPFWVKDPSTEFCYKFSDDALNWFQAQSTCKSMGAQLASVNNYHEERFIAGKIYKEKYINHKLLLLYTMHLHFSFCFGSKA